jgi:hypothetical protein
MSEWLKMPSRVSKSLTPDLYNLGGSEEKGIGMSVTNSVFTALMQMLQSKQPIPAGALIRAMVDAGHNQIEVRRAVQLAFERGLIELDSKMRIVIAEHAVAA